MLQGLIERFGWAAYDTSQGKFPMQTVCLNGGSLSAPDGYGYYRAEKEGDRYLIDYHSGNFWFANDPERVGDFEHPEACAYAMQRFEAEMFNGLEDCSRLLYGAERISAFTAYEPEKFGGSYIDADGGKWGEMSYVAFWNPQFQMAALYKVEPWHEDMTFAELLGKFHSRDECLAAFEDLRQLKKEEGPKVDVRKYEPCY